MNTITPDETSRPLGFWLKVADRLMAIEFAAAFDSEGITRRDWRLLNIIDGTTPGDRHKNDHPLPAHKLGRLIELGWVTDAEGTWTLTNDGRAAKERLGVIVDSIRAKVTDAVPADDLATTMTTLEQLARAFGWDEESPLPRKPRGRTGFGERGFGERGFGPNRHGFGHPGHGPRHFDYDGHGAPDYDEHGAPGVDDHGACHHGRPHGHGDQGGHRGHGGGHPRARFARFAQGAYERGFDAGFTRARDDR